MSKNLLELVRQRIDSIELGEKYVKEFFASVNMSGGTSSVASGQFGTSIPVYFGSIDTFVANPSNVSLGIIARMIETDPTIMSAVQFKSLMMLSKIGEFQHDKPEIAEFVQDYLKSMERPSWGKALEGLSSAFGYGFAVSEIIWGLNKKNQKVPRALKPYHPTTICFEVDAHGEVTENGVIQFTLQNTAFANPNGIFPYVKYGWTPSNPFETPYDRLLPYRLPFINNYGLMRIPRNKIVHIVNNSMLSFGSPYGKTPVRTAHLAWQLKVYFLKRLGIAGKRQAAPMLWATAPMNKNKVKVTMPDGKVVEKNPVEALSEILSAREGDDTIVTGSEEEGYKLSAIAAQIDMSQYLDVLNWLDVQIFRAFLLPSLVMTDGSAGSRSLGDKHFQVVDRIAEEDAKSFGEELIIQMIKKSIIDNFGEQDDYGHFAQRPQSIEERERLANMFNGLAQNGWMRPFDSVDGDFVKSSLHLPKQEESYYTEPMPNFDPLDPNGGGDEGDDKDEKPPKGKKE